MKIATFINHRGEHITNKENCKINYSPLSSERYNYGERVVFYPHSWEFLIKNKDRTMYNELAIRRDKISNRNIPLFSREGEVYASFRSTESSSVIIISALWTDL